MKTFMPSLSIRGPVRLLTDTEDDAFSMFAGEYPARVSRRAVGKPVSRHALMDNKTSLALGPRTFFF